MSANQSSGGSSWLDRPGTVGAVVRALVAVCALALVAGVGLLLFSHAYDHAHFDFERWPGFQAGFGFVAFLVIVYGGQALRRWVSRAEGYYGDDGPVDGRADDGSDLP